MGIRQYFRKKVEEYKARDNNDLAERAYTLSMQAKVNLLNSIGEVPEKVQKKLIDSIMSNPDFYIMVASIKREEEKPIRRLVTNLFYSGLELMAS